MGGILFEMCFAAAVVTVPLFQGVFAAALPEPWQIALLLPLPVMVWGCHEVLRWRAHRGRKAGHREEPRSR
ncbi:hypothetical protein ACH47B_30915 [Rhodococcus sp. NPDC019627]|uniref:hypothetical protein n=1 Tax=unclassified Rhodococcus (in: high G+C Gram-positive bacteria) TaxID=192944 RepID=UPI00340A3ACE